MVVKRYPHNDFLIETEYKQSLVIAHKSLLKRIRATASMPCSSWQNFL